MTSDYIYEWEFEDKKNRSSLWYIIAFAIVIGLVIWGFFTQQYGMSFLVLLITGITYFVENNSDEYVKVSIGENGIKIANVFYEYSMIDAFSCIYEGEKALFVRIFFNKNGIKVLDLKVNNNNIGEIKTILGNKIKEEREGKLNLGDKVISKLKL